ncbi:MAG TPA: DUF4198 domain-containing protein [Mucilaginibacter sp.]|jgi:hypothetical protein|nr:DUF4198 domain-containing protein [Mucilaginibacter sp.]
MKHIYFLLFCLFSLSITSAYAQDYVLLPENFILHKGDKLDLHLITVNQFTKTNELKYEASKTVKFMLASPKKTDLLTMAKDSAAPIISIPATNEGLNTITMVRKTVTDDIESDDFIKMLEDEGFTQYAEKAKNGSKDSFREKYTWYLKSLVEVEKNSGNGFDKPLNEDFEIILKDNPYKGSYGADIIAQVKLRGKAMVNVNVMMYVKTADGRNIFAQKLSSDKEGQIYFKLSREGVYLLRALYTEPSKDKGADFETWMTCYTFGFSSSNEMPNTYREFGFGNKH